MRSLGASEDDRRDRGNYAPNCQVMNVTYDYGTGIGPLTSNSLVGGHKPTVEDVTLVWYWVKETLTQGPPHVPQLGSDVRTAGEGGWASPGAQAHLLCNITLHLFPSCVVWAEHLGCNGEHRGKRREVALGRLPLKGLTSESGIELPCTKWYLVLWRAKGVFIIFTLALEPSKKPRLVLWTAVSQAAFCRSSQEFQKLSLIKHVSQGRNAFDYNLLCPAAKSSRHSI